MHFFTSIVKPFLSYVIVFFVLSTKQGRLYCSEIFDVSLQNCVM